MKKILFFVLVYFLYAYTINANESFLFEGKIKCELSSTFIVFDFDNKIAIRNNYNASQYKLSNYETKKNKFNKTIYAFSWYSLKNNFLGYWVLSEDLTNIVEIKFDKECKIFSVSREFGKSNKKDIGELIWE